MSTLATAAAAAYAAELAAREAERDRLRQELRQTARALVDAVIAPVTWKDSGLAWVHVDLDARLAVASDGTVALAVLPRRRAPDELHVRVVTGSGTDWTTGPAVDNLAELGAALEARP